MAATFVLGVLLLGAAPGGGPPSFVGPEEVLGDGRTPVVVELRAAPEDAEVQATGGRLEGTERTQDGTLRLSWVPPRVAGVLEVVFTATRGRGRPPDARWSVRVGAPPVRPALPARRLTVTPGELRAGGEPVEVAVASGEAGSVLRVSAGTGGPLEAADGRWAARYTPPREGFPQPVIAAVVAADGTLRDWAVLPVHGLGAVEAQTEPDASVSFRVGGLEFGPVRTDARGTATMPIQVPPGEPQALAIATDRLGNVRETLIELGVPEVRPLLLLCPRGRHRVEVLAVDAEGAPARGARLSLTAEGATAGPLRELEPGRYVAPLTRADPERPVRLRAGWVGGRGPGSACELEAEPRPVVPPPPVTAPVLPAAPPGRAAVTPRLGYVFTGGRFSSAVALADVGWRPGSWPWLSLSLEGGFSLARGTDEDASGVGPLGVTRWMAPLLVRASVRPWDQGLSPYGGPSAGVALAGGRAESPRIGTVDLLQALPAVGAHAGVEWRVGPGRVAVEATYLHGWPVGAGASEQLGAFLVSGGYRFER